MYDQPSGGELRRLGAVLLTLELHLRVILFGCVEGLFFRTSRIRSTVRLIVAGLTFT